jgi:sulfatase modifying factor 1
MKPKLVSIFLIARNNIKTNILPAIMLISIFIFILSACGQSAPPVAETSEATFTLAPAPSTAVETPAKATSTATIIPTPILGVGAKDGAILVYVPGGEFTMGSDSHNNLDEHPIHKVKLNAFWIDQTEVTNQLFSSFVRVTGYRTNAEKQGSSYVHDSSSTLNVIGADWQHPAGPGSDILGKENHPVIHVSWNDAAAYCEWADRRLPTEAEWEKAASWNDLTQEKYVYPWGNDFNGSNVNFCDKNCTLIWTDKNSDDGFAGIAPVRSFPNGASPYGAYDMEGNVWEWTADWYDVYPGGDSSISTDFGQRFRVMRGGAWSEDVRLIGYIVNTTYRFRIDPTVNTDYFGFRCASSLP